MSFSAIILAAGKGTRMKSDLLKVAHRVAGKPMVSYVVDAALGAGAETITVVVGHQAERVTSSIKGDNIHFVTQEEQLGTGHAVMQAEPSFQSIERQPVMVLAGDTPLIETDTLKKLLELHIKENAAATILTTDMPEPATYGRILRGENGNVSGIREAKDCTEEQLEIKEINTGVYVFDSQKLFESLKNVTTENAQKEYYLTDVIHILQNNGDKVTAYKTDDAQQTIGINTRIDLAKTNKIFFSKKNQELMGDGVTLIDPESTIIDQAVVIGKDTVIHPFTVISGKSTIGSNCEVGPNSCLNDAAVKNGTALPAFTFIKG